MAKGCVLIVEDDAGLREALADTLELAGFEHRQAESGEAALALLATQSVDMVVSDVNMGEMDGHELLRQIQLLHPVLPVLLITAYGQVERAVDAIRNGAVDYLLKPFEPEQLVEIVQRHISSTLSGESLDPVAEESSSRQLLQLARRVAATDSTVLILGESGTGKEVLARYIHRHSPRADAPFVAINCAAIPENMLEATLFGHEKGAFTGAHASSPGKFEQANGGTLLLDEISEMDLGLQAKLLRVLQEREVERIGGRRTINLDVRVLATSNRDLQQSVASGAFREDLFYRLNVFPLQWLPLRERPRDIVPLAERLLAHHARKMGRSGVSFDPDAQAALAAHPWPGNVRELENAVQRALILQTGSRVGAVDLCLSPAGGALSVNLSQPVSALAAGNDNPLAEANGGLGDDLRMREFQLIIEALRNARGSRKEASDKLGISPRTLRYKLAQMRERGIDIEAELD